MVKDLKCSEASDSRKRPGKDSRQAWVRLKSISELPQRLGDSDIDEHYNIDIPTASRLTAFLFFLLAAFTMSAKQDSTKAEHKTKKFGKSDRSIPHHTQKAKKFYPAEDEVKPKKVSEAVPSQQKWAYAHRMALG